MHAKRLTASIAAAMLAIGLAPPFASAQSERVVAVEDREAYVEEFNYDPNDPPVIDGVKGLTETEIAEYKQKIRQAEASGPPQDEIVAGQMWSDKVGIPEGVDKADADQSEVAIAKEQAQPQARSLRAAATQCKTFWLTPHRVCGAILNRYEALGGMASWLLLPIEGQKTNPDGQGTRQRFAGGFIYSHPTSGTHAVANHTANVWQRHGWEAGWLGYPTSGEVPVEGSTGIDGEINGWVQKFEGGQIYRTPVAQGFQVASINGLILEKWQDMGGPSSDLGFPIADEAKTPDGQGRFSVFQSGSIYWHPQHGAHVIDGAISLIWLLEGGQDGPHGYPISDVYLDDEANIKQDFNKGTINLKDYFDSDEVVLVDGKEIAKDLVDFLQIYLGVDISRGVSSQRTSPQTVESRSTMQAAQAWYPAQNSNWEYEQRILRVVSPILIPSNYVYNLSHPQRTLHDFCSYSQDLWGEDAILFNPSNRVADYRGPCARHDMCYDRISEYDLRVVTCDPSLRQELKTVCREAYGTSLSRANCWSTAEGMYQVVKYVQEKKNPV